MRTKSTAAIPLLLPSCRRRWLCKVTSAGRRALALTPFLLLGGRGLTAISAYRVASMLEGSPAHEGCGASAAACRAGMLARLR
jgi:hypothetical protein